jgi:DNA polymerase-3 subunit gamma/tau
VARNRRLGQAIRILPGGGITYNQFLSSMSYQVLARKYRPQKFSEVIGQEHVTRTLKNAIEQGRTAHGYIFSGHRGIGKTTVARILAMALNCRSASHPVPEPCGRCDSCIEIRAGNSVDVIEIDAATNRGIDEIRELREAARYRPARDRFKIYILDEAHQITDAAFNALLKTLEEPPGHVVFMLATTQPEDIPQTIRSRCQHFSFRAVGFGDIVDNLRHVVTRENITVDDNALALLAEAGDGSMRDALSILDQAIASAGDVVTADAVRQLIGSVPSARLEDMMQAVAHSSSEEVLRIADGLISEGQSPSHFAKQLVRFLRNAVVAKVAGQDSPLLQISADERARVGRIADLLSEEDLTRHLQIMLRTHSDLGYKQELRFHLELGLLKMVHAQRLLPMEQWLSEAAGSPATAPVRPAARTPILGEPRSATPASSPRSNYVSPFAADSARKTGKPEMAAESSPAAGTRVVTTGNSPSPIIMGSVAPSALREPIPAPPTDNDPTLQQRQGSAGRGLDDLRNTVLNALADAGHQVLVSMLETGEWFLEGNELSIKVAASSAVIDLSLGAEARRLAVATASRAADRALKLKVLPGGTAQAAPARSSSASNGGGRARAEHDPIVRRLQEKFGAEIRTIIDQRDRK